MRLRKAYKQEKIILFVQKNLAELIGVILGDGSLGVYKRQGRKCRQFRLKITLNSEKDFDYSKYVSALIKDVLKIKPYRYKRKNEKTLDLIITNKQAVKKLIEIGLHESPKWNNAVIPAKFLRRDLSLLVMRGYMDTDGCISVFDNNGIIYPRIEMKICPSPMQAQFIRILEENGFSPRVNDIGNGKVRIMLAGVKKLRKWNNTIGFSNKRNSDIANRFIKKDSGGWI